MLKHAIDQISRHLLPAGIPIFLTAEANRKCSSSIPLLSAPCWVRWLVLSARWHFITSKKLEKPRCSAFTKQSRNKRGSLVPNPVQCRSVEKMKAYMA